MNIAKTVVLGPIVLFFAVIASLMISFLIVMAKLFIKGKKSAWKGILIDKLHKQRENFDTDKLEDFYTLVFKTDTGKELKIGTSKQVWDEYKIGDKAEKKAGELWPKKIS